MPDRERDKAEGVRRRGKTTEQKGVVVIFQ